MNKEDYLVNVLSKILPGGPCWPSCHPPLQWWTGLSSWSCRRCTSRTRTAKNGRSQLLKRHLKRWQVVRALSTFGSNKKSLINFFFIFLKRISIRQLSQSRKACNKQSHNYHLKVKVIPYLHEVVVDQVDDLQMPWQDVADHIGLPALKGLR